MTEEIDFDDIKSRDKSAAYAEVIRHAEALVSGEPDITANLANIAALLKNAFDYYLWVGFYIYDKKSDELVLGPFQGKVACTRIAMGRGVCGTAARERKTILVEDVNKFPGHIFCDSSSKSEIVVPIMRNGMLFGVLDVDSAEYSSFDGSDKKGLEELAEKILFIFNE